MMSAEEKDSGETGFPLCYSARDIPSLTEVFWDI